MSPVSSSALLRVYGHSVEGINPSLLRFTRGGTSVSAYGVKIGSEAVEGGGGYFGSPDILALLPDDAECSAPRYLRFGRSMQRRARLYCGSAADRSPPRSQEATQVELPTIRAG